MAKTGMMVLCLVMVVVAPYVEAISCGQVASSLLPCLNYLRYGGTLPPACCTGIKSLNNAAKSTPDRRTVCDCLKNLYNANRSINVPKAASLPGKCGVNIPYKISPSTECSKIQ